MAVGGDNPAAGVPGVRGGVGRLQCRLVAVRRVIADVVWIILGMCLIITAGWPLFRFYIPPPWRLWASMLYGGGGYLLWDHFTPALQAKIIEYQIRRLNRRQARHAWKQKPPEPR